MLHEIPIRIILIEPPPGVEFCMQKGKLDLVAPSWQSATSITFDLIVSIDGEKKAAPPNFRGPFTQGRPGEKFIYINSGTYAGHFDSPWSRRAKIPLAGITWELIQQALSRPSAVLEARLVGTAKDGGPVCASVPLLDGGWKIVE
jgi:hypothetical protein